jgi:hypothetical protein
MSEYEGKKLQMYGDGGEGKPFKMTVRGRMYSSYMSDMGEIVHLSCFPAPFCVTVWDVTEISEIPLLTPVEDKKLGSCLGKWVRITQMSFVDADEDGEPTWTWEVEGRVSEQREVDGNTVIQLEHISGDIKLSEWSIEEVSCERI